MDAETQYAEAKRLYEAGQTVDAVSALERARAAYLAEGNAAQAARAANDLGVAYYRLGRWEEARRALQDARATFEQSGDAVGEAKAIGNLAQVLNRSGDKAGAETHYARAAALFQQAGERGLAFDTLRAWSHMQLQRGHWLEALATYDRALGIKGGARALRAFLQIPLRMLGARS